MHVTLCDYIMLWDAMSPTQKKSLSQRYQMGCDCKVGRREGGTVRRGEGGRIGWEKYALHVCVDIYSNMICDTVCLVCMCFCVFVCKCLCVCVCADCALPLPAL